MAHFIGMATAGCFSVNLYCVIAAIGSIIIRKIYMKEKLKIYSQYAIAMGIPYDWRYKIGRSNNG